jgi:dUTP pyrophosphatase
MNQTYQIISQDYYNLFLGFCTISVIVIYYVLNDLKNTQDKLRKSLQIPKIRYTKTHHDACIAFGKEGDAGYDLVAIEDSYVGRDTVNVRTGIKMEIPSGYFGCIMGKSSMSPYLAVRAGVIDSSYRGEIVIPLQFITKDCTSPFQIIDPKRKRIVPDSVHKDYQYWIQKGDKIAQIIFIKIGSPTEFIETKVLSETSRGDGAFGSTGGSILKKD